METQALTFAASPFVPVAIGFFGLGTGYFIWGGQALFGFPKTNPEVNRSLGLWGFWMPGFMQLLTGIYLLVGLTWFNVFHNAAPLYMAALAFTAYGIHWIAMAHRRYIDSNVQLDGHSLPVSQHARRRCLPACRRPPGDGHLCRPDFDLCHRSSTRFFSWTLGLRLIGLFQFATGVWLMYCTYAMTVDLALGAKVWI